MVSFHDIFKILDKKIYFRNFFVNCGVLPIAQEVMQQ